MSKITKSALSIASSLLFVLLAFISSSTAASTGYDVVKVEEISYVEKSIHWKPELLSFAENAMEPQRAAVEELLKTMSKGANSMTVERDFSALVPDFDPQSNYPYFDHYNHPILIETFTDWGTNVAQNTWVPDDQGSALSLLATLPEGTCKFSWSLFNVHTWFAPDCAVRVASAETYLRTALIDWLYRAPDLVATHSLDATTSLIEICEKHLPYTVVNGRLYSDGLYEYMRTDGIPIENDQGYYGWRYVFDPADKWNITFEQWSDIQTAQDLADLGHLETFGGETSILFSK
jgi:hypothetical protein